MFANVCTHGENRGMQTLRARLDKCGKALPPPQETWGNQIAANALFPMNKGIFIMQARLSRKI